ncbi:TPA: hypothetical protein DDZ86_04785 [Candidatus Dependentiae bacterium]|nr:MAG: hypothetical protein A2Y17_09590 [Clostridiales bacterium GWF2_38_85]HBL98928.1 hypothetical protein [Candidatus Dependentiae bacterium]
MKSTQQAQELSALAEAKEHISSLLCPQDPEEWSPYNVAVVEKVITHFPQSDNFLAELIELRLFAIEESLRFVQRDPEIVEAALFDVLFLSFVEIGEMLSFVEDEELGLKGVERMETIAKKIDKISKEHGEAFVDLMEEMAAEDDEEDECDECDEDEDDSCSCCCSSKKK